MCASSIGLVTLTSPFSAIFENVLDAKSVSPFQAFHLILLKLEHSAKHVKHRNSNFVALEKSTEVK
ncbi:MAG: hypothetical protein K2L48_04250 [Mycoplasmoidaceae bacterium]|nr:hypothetical protein [Mycoplasmoidaceae bacterium]